MKKEGSDAGRDDFHRFEETFRMENPGETTVNHVNEARDEKLAERICESIYMAKGGA